MPLELVSVTGSVLLPDGLGFAHALEFQLSGPDRDGPTALAQAPIKVALRDGALPPGFTLWRNMAGDRGTLYEVTAYVTTLVAGGQVSLSKPFRLGGIQVGGAEVYTLGDLLAQDAGPAPVWIVNLDPAQYAALQAEIAASTAAAVSAAASAGQAAASEAVADGAADAARDSEVAAEAAAAAAAAAAATAVADAIAGLADIEIDLNAAVIEAMPLSLAARSARLADAARDITASGAADPRDEAATGVVVGVVLGNGGRAGITETGAIVTRRIDLYPDGDNRDSAADYQATIECDAGTLLGFLDEGRVHLAGLRLDLKAVAGADDRDDIGEYRPIISGVDPAGAERVILALDANGAVFVPGAAEIITVPEFREPETLRGTHGQFNIRQTATHIYASVQSRGAVCDVEQRRNLTTYTTAVAVGPVEGIIAIGQSNIMPGSGEVGPPLLEATAFPHHVLKPNGFGALDGVDNHVATMAGRVDLTAYSERIEFAQTPAFMMGEALAELEAREWRITPRVFFTSGRGSQPLENFFPLTSGQHMHENAIAGAQAIQRLATEYHGSTLAAVLMIQGEAATADYDVLLASYLDTVLPLFGMAVSGPTPHFVYVQINRETHAESLGTAEVPLKQLAVARARVGSGVTMSGPMYHAPVHDNIHASDRGRMLVGEQNAVAWRAARSGIDWHPLWPVAGGVTRSSVTVTVPFSLPPGALALALDTDWVEAAPDMGFVYADDSATGITITAVAISGNSVVLTLSANPGAAVGQRIEYALFNAPNDTGWASGRRQLYATTGIASPFHARGFDLPPEIRHYAVRFRETIA